MAKVSIIVPIYKVEKYLDRCMESLLNQTLTDIEIIMVDDGSPDKCPQMCDEYAQRDMRIKVVHKQNEGLGFARNSGLSIASGEYVAFVDSDDYVDTEMYKSLYDIAKKERLDYVSCGHYYKTREGAKPVDGYVKTKMLFSGKEDMNGILLGMVSNLPNEKRERFYSMSVWHGIYRNRIIKSYNIRFLSEREVLSEDMPFQVDFFSHADKACFLPTPMYYYCENEASLTHTFTENKFDCAKKLYQVIKSKIRHLDVDSVRVSRLFITYARMMVIDSVSCKNKKRNQKIMFLRYLVNDAIWSDIKYPYHKLDLSKCIMQSLIIGKNTYLLYHYAKIYNFVKKSRR